MKSISSVVRSFRDTKIWTFFLYDALFIIILFFLIFSFGWLVQQKAYALGVQSAEQFQQILISAPPEQAQQLVMAMKSLVITFVVGFSVIFL